MPVTIELESSTSYQPYYRIISEICLEIQRPSEMKTLKSQGRQLSRVCDPISWRLYYQGRYEIPVKYYWLRSPLTVGFLHSNYSSLLPVSLAKYQSSAKVLSCGHLFQCCMDHSTDNGFTGQMPKTRSLHQSYQCLVLLPYRRFLWGFLVHRLKSWYPSNRVQRATATRMNSEVE